MARAAGSRISSAAPTPRPRTTCDRPRRRRSAHDRVAVRDRRADDPIAVPEERRDRRPLAERDGRLGDRSPDQQVVEGLAPHREREPDVAGILRRRDVRRRVVPLVVVVADERTAERQHLVEHAERVEHGSTARPRKKCVESVGLGEPGSIDEEDAIAGSAEEAAVTTWRHARRRPGRRTSAPSSRQRMTRPVWSRRRRSARGEHALELEEADPAVETAGVAVSAPSPRSRGGTGSRSGWVEPRPGRRRARRRDGRSRDRAVGRSSRRSRSSVCTRTSRAIRGSVAGRRAVEPVRSAAKYSSSSVARRCPSRRQGSAARSTGDASSTPCDSRRPRTRRGETARRHDDEQLAHR